MSQRRYIPFITHAHLHVLLAPPRQGELPEVIKEAREMGTGTEAVILTCKAGDHIEVQEFQGATYTGVATADLLLELQRIGMMRQVLDHMEEQVKSALAARGES